MSNGKISQFIKDHWFCILGVTVVCSAVLYCVYSCSVDPSINVITKGNRIRVELPKHK